MHVLSLPPAFVLSQDQTLKLRRLDPARSRSLTDQHALACWLDEDTLSASLRSGPSYQRRVRRCHVTISRRFPGSRSAGTTPPTFLFLRIHLSKSPVPVHRGRPCLPEFSGNDPVSRSLGPSGLCFRDEPSGPLAPCGVAAPSVSGDIRGGGFLCQRAIRKNWRTMSI